MMRNFGMKIMSILLTMSLAMSMGCGGKAVATSAAQGEAEVSNGVTSEVPQFNADSAYVYLKRQVDFGPRVPNSSSHSACGDWLVAELERRGAEVHQQRADLRAFDGTVLKARNIFVRFNPDVKENRLLLLAHYDTRPWADQDEDDSKHQQPIDGANDGASGVAVLLEIARVIAADNPGKGIDILFCDAEDYGTDNNDESWAMGARYFAQNMRANGWNPSHAILLDMVGGKNAKFPYEYFSRQAAPQLDKEFRDAAASAGYASYFPQEFGGAVTDDHLELLKQGVKAIDIIEYDKETGFNPAWHTTQDNLDNISVETLRAVGQSLVQYIYGNRN